MTPKPGTAAPAAFDRSGGEWSRRLCALALAVLGLLALLGLAVGVLSQVVIGAEYAQEVDAELNRPLIVPCLVAVVAGGAGAVSWWSTFLRGATPAWVPALFVAAMVVSLAMAFALARPSSRTGGRSGSAGSGSRTRSRRARPIRRSAPRTTG